MRWKLKSSDLKPSGRAKARRKSPEEKFQADIKKWAEANGWLYYHTHRSDRSPKGFPDVVMVRGGRIIFAELKAGKNKATTEQLKWLDELGKAEVLGSNVSVYLWYPFDWPYIENLLRRR